MFKLRYGYLLSGIITGSILFVNFLGFFPDGKLHVYVCSVGQGDAIYVRFPDGRDMLVDGGPNDSVLQCLGRHMPFWDRKINLIVNSHPENDHLKGLIAVVDRFHVDYVVTSGVSAPSDIYTQFIERIKIHHVPVRLVHRGDTISVGSAVLSVLWPSSTSAPISSSPLNEFSLMVHLHYGTFDALFPGDKTLASMELAVDSIELLKVPHHGSRSGMTQTFIDVVKPKVSVISVGKNSYGHPSAEAITMLQSVGSVIHRTDKEGDIEVVSDGRGWRVLGK